jgi:hypothetical protein
VLRVQKAIGIIARTPPITQTQALVILDFLSNLSLIRPQIRFERNPNPARIRALKIPYSVLKWG